MTYMAELLKKDPRRRLGAKGSADVMAHPWFLKGGIEWDVFLADAAEPPFVPNQDINAASQSVIGSFNDENQYRKVCAQVIGCACAPRLTDGRCCPTDALPTDRIFPIPTTTTTFR